MKLFHADRDENQNCEIFIAAFQFNFEKVLPITLCRINRANSQQLGRTIEYSIPQIMHASNASPARANYSSFQSVISFNIDESRVVLLHTRVEQKNSIFILRLPHETETRNISEFFASTFRSIVSWIVSWMQRSLASDRWMKLFKMLLKIYLYIYERTLVRICNINNWCKN